MERSSEDGSAGERRPSTDPHHGSPPSGLGLDEDAEPRLWLKRTIETEIIPRLMLAHRSVGCALTEADEPAGDVLDRDDIIGFTALLLRDDVDACMGFVEALRERGIGLEQVYLGLLAPAARRLGALWESDDCDFAQVTLGLWRLQSLVFDLSPQLPATFTSRPDGPRRALLAAVPGSQHTFGLLMVAEFFRRAGWDVWSDPCASEGDMAALVRSEWFDLVGLSVGTSLHVPSLGSVILAIRRASRNPSVGVMVGGPLLIDRPEVVDEVGADFTAPDARQAVERAEAFVESRCRPS